MSPLLSCKNLTLGYDGKAVVSGLSFEVNQGDYLCVVGDNGSGKSTLMKTLLNLKTPMSGEITFEDGDFQRNEIGYLPQQSIIQKDFPASVKEVVRSGCLNRCGLRPYFNAEENKLVKASMAKLQIENLENRCYRELSGGQQQRVLLARALCATRKILLLDEPVAGLDPNATSEMYGVIKELNNDGVTIIMISHDIASSIKYATHILKLADNSVKFFGTKEDYVKSEVCDSCGVPIKGEGGDAK